MIGSRSGRCPSIIRFYGETDFETVAIFVLFSVISSSVLVSLMKMVFCTCGEKEEREKEKKKKDFF